MLCGQPIFLTLKSTTSNYKRVPHLGANVSYDSVQMYNQTQFTLRSLPNLCKLMTLSRLLVTLHVTWNCIHCIYQKLQIAIPENMNHLLYPVLTITVYPRWRCHYFKYRISLNCPHFPSDGGFNDVISSGGNLYPNHTLTIKNYLTFSGRRWEWVEPAISCQKHHMGKFIS